MTLEDVAVDLYGFAPAAFVAARAARVAEAKDASDKELATAIGKLRKPTVVAWTVNLLARAAPDDVEALLRLGAALRAAQRELSGEQLRALTAQRQQVVNALAKRAGALAAERGHPVGAGVLREVGQTLSAALADDAVAEQVRSGTLTTAASYEGFGPSGAALTAVDGTGTTESVAAPPDTAPEDARKELAQALEALESTRAARDSAQSAAEQAANHVAESKSRIETLRAELAHAEEQKQFARTADRGAQDQLRSAQKQLDRVERWVQRARERVDGE
ncbi:hypothetical protein OG874_39030 [Nocardia sp. NBC_00565]|uniref:hypothetical protein n=1 Tax=Nocardia sp. NBC_00565 TaxID=2975993 RepID=UPI002E8010A4|nr:hypothetical protein [Nocardia sp. NBC_00565]WUC02637.1 hypothetical protein OG874_39030 [Nocardia sp. NBC_00565]